MATEDQGDEEGKSYEIQNDEPTNTGGAGGATGADGAFFGSSDTTIEASLGGSGGGSGPSNMDPERQAEIERLKKEMADAKEEIKEEEEAAEKYKDMQEEMTTTRKIKRMETETFKLEN